jgi:hypothetical protein
MIEKLLQVNQTTLPNVFEIDNNLNIIPYRQNEAGEFGITPPDLNIMALAAIENYIENYKMRIDGMGPDWQKTIAQAHIMMIIQFLQENL